MNNNYEIKEILSAIETLLRSDKNKPLKLINEVQEPLILEDQPQNTKKQDRIPRDTEKIILEAEKFLKK